VALLFAAMLVSRSPRSGRLLRLWLLADNAATARLRQAWNFSTQFFVPSCSLAISFVRIGGAVAQVGLGRLLFAPAIAVLAASLG
jgi:hypothetical protein